MQISSARMPHSLGSIDLRFAGSIASSWLWGLGFFYSMHVMLTYGPTGFFLFALPNAFGLGLFGVLLGRRPDLAAWWSQVQGRYAGFFLLYQVAAVAITLFAVGAGFWQPIVGSGAAAGVFILAIAACLFGHVAGLEGLRRWHGALLVLGVGSALAAITSLSGSVGPARIAHDTRLDARFLGLMLPTLIGFLLGPWLDIQQWQRAVAIRARGASVGRTYVVGAVLFFGLLCVNAALAAAAGLVAVRMPFGGVPEAITATSVAVAQRPFALAAFALWVAIAMVSTLDSFYVATRQLLGDLSRRSSNALLALVPGAVAGSPFWVLIPALMLASAGLSHDAPMMAFLMPFATILVGAAACLVADTVYGARGYDPVVCLCVGVLASVPFGVGYLFANPTMLWAGSAFALLPLLQWLGADAVVQTGAPATQERVEPVATVQIQRSAETVAASSGFQPDGWFAMAYTPTYDDTNSVGNVYFANYFRYVGKCRELFFAECMPDFDIKTTTFVILTKDFEHKFRREVVEFEPLVVRLRVERFNRRFVTLEHEITTAAGDLVGKGSQQLMFVDRRSEKLVEIPGSVMTAFMPHFRHLSNSNRPRSSMAAA